MREYTLNIVSVKTLFLKITATIKVSNRPNSGTTTQKHFQIFNGLN